MQWRPTKLTAAPLPFPWIEALSTLLLNVSEVWRCFWKLGKGAGSSPTCFWWRVTAQYLSQEADGERRVEHPWERQSEDAAIPVRHGSGDPGKIPASFCDPSEADWAMGANSSPSWSLCKAELPAWKDTTCPAGRSHREVWLPSKAL